MADASNINHFRKIAELMEPLGVNAQRGCDPSNGVLSTPLSFSRFSALPSSSGGARWLVLKVAPLKINSGQV